MEKLILRDKIHSKWLILFIDQVIVVCTLFLAIVLTYGNKYADCLLYTSDAADEPRHV